MDYKPIQTRYKGCKFRSRLEARWAVFFDAMAIEWEYEKEGYELPSGNYLPDFWLPQVSMWAEVKAVVLTRPEYLLCEQLARFTQREVLMLVGPPKLSTYPAINGAEYNHGAWDVLVNYYDIHEAHNYWLYEKRFYWANSEQLDFGCDHELPNPPVADALWQNLVFQLSCERVSADEFAINAARSARFEHGESGAA